ncbi:MAG TPA: hypothetical protein VIH57_12360 [Bacteroidales bacterium]
MNIEKVKNYNQKILAILGSLGILLLVVLILMTLQEFLRTFSYRHPQQNQEIVSNEKAQENYKNNKRTHQISFENFELIDTARGIYLIPVSQTALEIKEFISKKEKSSEGGLALMANYKRNQDFLYNYESYNNALLYDSRSGAVTQLFDKRVSINRIYVEKIKDISYVFMAVTKDDTDKDGIMDEQDFKTLYVFSTADNKLKEIRSDRTDFNTYYILKDKEQLVIKYGLDKNNDGTHGWDEPLIMKTYSLVTGKLENLIDKKLNDTLQGLLDGKN